jgi:hypothetical protein
MPLARGNEMVGHVPIEAVDRGARHEFLDIDDAGRFELHGIELFLVEQHVLALGDVEPLHQITARAHLASAGIDGLHADAVVGLGFDHVEAHGAGLRRRRPQCDRTG